MNDDQPQPVKPPQARLQYPLWFLFVLMALVAMFLPLLIHGGVRAVTIALGMGGMSAAFFAGFFVERLGRYCWAIVAGAVTGSVLALLNGLGSGAIHRENLVSRGHRMFDHPEVETAEKLASIGALAGVVIGVATGWRLHLRVRRRQETSDSANIHWGRSRKARLSCICALMEAFLFPLGIILSGAGDPRQMLFCSSEEPSSCCLRFCWLWKNQPLQAIANKQKVQLCLMADGRVGGLDRLLA